MTERVTRPQRDYATLNEQSSPVQGNARKKPGRPPRPSATAPATQKRAPRTRKLDTAPYRDQLPDEPSIPRDKQTRIPKDPIPESKMRHNLAKYEADVEGWKYEPKLGFMIAGAISRGLPIDVLEDEHDWFPPFGVVLRWEREHPEFAETMRLARETYAHIQMSRVLPILDEVPTSLAGERGGLDPTHVAWAKNRADMRFKFGERLLAQYRPTTASHVSQEVTHVVKPESIDDVMKEVAMLSEAMEVPYRVIHESEIEYVDEDESDA